MIAGSVSARDRRTLVTGACVVALIIGVGRGGPAWLTWTRARVNAAAEAGEQLASAKRSAFGLAAFTDSANVRSRRLDSVRALLVRARTPESAAASFASLVGATAEAQGADVIAVTLSADTVVRWGMARVAVRLSAESDLAGLMALLAVLETRPMPIVIRDLSVSQPDPAAPRSKADALRFDMVVQTLAAIRREPAGDKR